MSWKNRRRRSSDAAEKQSRIRKRGCSSSSSSSSLLGECRFKLAILAAKRVGSTTPVPTWKVMVNRSPSSRISSSEILNCPPTLEGGRAKDHSVSARKLAATLWEINEVPTQTEAEVENKLKLREKTAMASRLGLSDPDPFHSPVSERLDRSEGVGEQRRITDDGLDGYHSASLMEIPTHSRTGRKCTRGRKSTLKEVRNGLATAKELLKVLNHLWVFEGENPSVSSVCSALETELNKAKEHVDELLKEQRSNHRETEQLLRCFAEEKAIWVRKERERIRNAVQSIAGEVKVEKKMRKQAERLNKKLGRELAHLKDSLINAANEAKREKRAKEIFEQICDELARGIGEDRAHVEELKKESVKAREEVEKEREMLQLADVLREERVQMKLSEAKFHFEEKNAAVEKLKTELEAYLKNKSSRENDDESPKVEKIKELEAYLKEINFGSSRIAEDDDDQGQVEDGGENEEEEEEEEEDSADSDLHSIELNMDNNNKSYRWSFATQEPAQSDSKRNSLEKEVKGRKSFSEKIQWGSICFNRGASTGKNGDSGSKSQGNSDRFDSRKLSDLLQIQPKENEGEIQKQKSLNCLKDHIFSGAKVAPAQSFGYPTPQRSQSYPFS